MDFLKPTPPDDALLLHQLSSGRKDAFDALYNKYWETLYTNAYRRLKDKELSKDVVQEIFTHLWLKRATLRIENLPAYFHVAVRNSVLKLLSKQKYTHPFFNLLETAQASIGHADAQLLWKEFLSSYEAILTSLPTRRQLIFRLRFQDDLSTKEIAAKLHLSRNTVQNQLSKATEQLRVSLNALSTFFIFWIIC